MISKETCQKIWHCHREIEVSNQSIEGINEFIQKNNDYKTANEFARSVENTWGGGRGVEMQVPSNESGSSKSIYNVSPELALAVIKAHIANKTAELAELNEISKIELMEG